MDYSCKETDKFFWVILTFCHACRDLLASLEIPVFPLLVVIFAIPCLILIREILHRRITGFQLGLIGFVVCFYTAIIPINLNGFKYVLPLLLTALAFRNVDFKFIARSFLLLQAVSFFIRLILIAEGTLVSNPWLAWKESVSISYDLAYRNPNTLGIVVFFMLCGLYIITYERHKIFSFFVIAMASAVTYLYSASRTALFSCVLLLLTYFVPERFLKRYIYSKSFLYAILIGMLAFPFLSEFILSNSELDTLMSGRVYLLSLLMEVFSSPVTFVTGLQVDMEGVDFPVDNLVAYMLILGGIFYVGILGVRFLGIIREKKIMPTCLITVIIVILASGLGEKSAADFSVGGASLFWALLFNTSYRMPLIFDSNNR